MKSLVIAEKPSVARDIARVLHCTQKGNGILRAKNMLGSAATCRTTCVQLHSEPKFG